VGEKTESKSNQALYLHLVAGEKEAGEEKIPKERKDLPEDE